MKAGADMISSNLPQIMTHGFLAMDWTSPNLAHSDLVPASEEPTQTSRKRSISDVIDQNDSKIDSSVQSVVEPSTVATSALETDFSKKLNQNAMRSLPNEDEKDQKEHRDSFQKNAITARLKMKRSLYSNYCIDMADTRFARDTEPLVAGCQCHACRYAKTILYIYL